MGQVVGVKNRKLRYLPAINLAKSRFTRLFQGTDGNEYIANWWSKNSPFNYDSILVSGFYGMAFPELKKDFGFPENMFVMLDSGGYQNVMVEGADVSPQKLLDWQQKNGTAGLILDHPPYEANGVQFGGNINHNFKSGLAKTMENAKIALSLKDKDDFHLYGVVQGETPQQMLDWFSGMCEVELDAYQEFDAWALSPKPSTDVLKVALYGVFAINHLGGYPIHLLQISGFDTILVAAYITKRYDGIVSIDSSTFALGERYGRFADLYSFGQFHDFGHNEEQREAMGLGDTKKIHLSRMPCVCPVCSINGKSTTELTNNDYTLLNLHNLYQIVQFVNYAEVIAEDPEFIREFTRVNSKNWKRVHTAFDMIDRAGEGLDKVFERYKHQINYSEDSLKQNTLARW